MPRPWRALQAELSGDANQAMAPTSAESAWPIAAKNAGHDHGRRRCGRADPVPGARRRTSCLSCDVLRRCGCGGPGVCRAERVSPPANSRFSYFLLSVRNLTKWGYEELQNMSNSILRAVETTLHPHGQLKCWCKVRCGDLSQLLDAERIKLIGSQRIVQPRARASVEP